MLAPFGWPRSVKSRSCFVTPELFGAYFGCTPDDVREVGFLDCADFAMATSVGASERFDFEEVSSEIVGMILGSSG